MNDPLYNHVVFGPTKGKGGLIGKSDDQLIQDLIAIHNAENWLGMDGDTELSMFNKHDSGDRIGILLKEGNTILSSFVYQNHRCFHENIKSYRVDRITKCLDCTRLPSTHCPIFKVSGVGRGEGTDQPGLGEGGKVRRRDCRRCFLPKEF